ncbi:hypothetical protein, partial [Klebsiella pneumoniae]
RLPLTLMTLDDWALATISGPDSVFRVRDDAGSLSIKPLPYSLEEN